MAFTRLAATAPTILPALSRLAAKPHVAPMSLSVGPASQGPPKSSPLHSSLLAPLRAVARNASQTQRLLTTAPTAAPVIKRLTSTAHKAASLGNHDNKEAQDAQKEAQLLLDMQELEAQERKEAARQGTRKP